MKTVKLDMENKPTLVGKLVTVEQATLSDYIQVWKHMLPESMSVLNSSAQGHWELMKSTPSTRLTRATEYVEAHSKGLGSDLPRLLEDFADSEICRVEDNTRAKFQRQEMLIDNYRQSVHSLRTTIAQQVATTMDQEAEIAELRAQLDQLSRRSISIPPATAGRLFRDDHV
jgi:hypothetical protein